MKQIIITFLFFIVSIAPGFAQPSNPFSNHGGPFKVIDIQTISANYMIVSCRDDLGRTIQFQAPVLKGRTEIVGITKSKPNTLILGIIVIPDFTAETVSPANDNTIKYKIVKPSFSSQCCSITKITRLTNDEFHIFVIAKKDTANGLTYFIINNSLFNAPNLNFQIGQPIYQKLFNNVRYAVLKHLIVEELNRNIFYSYELNFMTNEFYNSHHKEEETDTTTTSQGTVSNPFDSTIFNQPWETTGTSYPNSPTGFIHLNVPVEAECTINIYNILNHSLFTSSNEKRLFILPTGNFDVEISGMMIKNVPIGGNMDTRIKSGALNITSTSSWTLYDENKVKTIYSSSLPKKVEFPRGIYQLEINGLAHQIEIKDGETLEYNDTSQATQTQKLNTGDPNNNKAIKHEDPMAVPVDNGYESIKIFARINNDEEMEVKVNGRIVATYTKDVGVNLDGFLKRNAMNVISFKFSAEAKNSNVELSGKFPGNDDWNTIFNFNPKAGKTESQFEVPFTGKKR